jgi:hypothetical protein
MTPVTRGVVIAVAQLLIVSAVGGKLLYDRHALPSAWALTTGVDPMLPIRGRYVSLRLVVDPDPATTPADAKLNMPTPARLSVRDGRLQATFTGEPGEAFSSLEGESVMLLETPAGKMWALAGPVAFFLPESAPDPTALAEGQQLWAEVTVPERGNPRPIRLEVRQVAAN